MIIFINIDKIIFINTTVIDRRICYSASLASDIPVKADKKPIKTYIRACAPDVTPTCTVAVM